MPSTGHSDAIRDLVAPGAPFEIVSADVLGQRLPVYANAPRNMRAVLEASLELEDRPFLVYGDTRWSYADHGLRVRRLAAHLRDEWGIGHGDRVCIGMRNYPEWVLSFWTLQAIGAVAVPLNAWWTGAELEHAVRDSGAVAAIVDDERLERLERLRPHLPEQVRAVLVARSRSAPPEGVTALEAVIEGERPAPPVAPVDIEPDDPSTIMYTSGTTGTPKGAVQTHRNHCTNLTNIALAAAAAAGGGASDPGAPARSIGLQTFPFFHIGGLTGLYASTAFGATLVLMYKWDAAEAVRLVVDEGVTSVAGVPTVVRELFDALDREGVVATQLGAVSSGGAPVPPSLIERIGDRSGRAIRPANGYGLTETTSAVVSNSGDDYYEHPDSVGRPVPVAEVSIRDEAGRPVEDGVTGELWVRGPNVVAGYWNNDEATREAFTDGWFHTGDAAFVRDGFVYVVDRLKDVVLRGGENVYCAEVEAAIHAIEGVVDVAVIGVEHEVLGEEVAAVIELAPRVGLTAADIQRQVAARLAAFKVPSRIHLAATDLPRTATGKAQKREIRAAVNRGDERFPLLEA